MTNIKSANADAVGGVQYKLCTIIILYYKYSYKVVSIFYLAINEEREFKR